MIRLHRAEGADSGDGAAQNVLVLGYDRSALTGENTIKAYARCGIDLAVIADLKF